jgi:multiple sugar transport system permease protein
MRVSPVQWLKLRSSKHSTLRRHEALLGFLFVLPWILSLLAFTVYPVVASFYLSLTDYNIIQAPRWIGLDNYHTMLTNDPSFWKGVSNTASYTVVSVPLNLVFALILALILNIQAKGIGIYQTLFYLPALVPPVSVTIVFVLMFSPNGGIINAILEGLGLSPPNWLMDPAWSKTTLLIMNLWSIGPSTLIFLAGLKQIPRSLLDAAAVDGAGEWKKLRYITLPLLSPVILYNLIIGIIGAFQVFTQALIIGGTGGQPVESTLMYMVLIYRNAFAYFKMGYASALAVVLFVAIVVVTILIFYSARVWVHYEDHDGLN